MTYYVVLRYIVQNIARDAIQHFRDNIYQCMRLVSRRIVRHDVIDE